ncbi:TIGR04255 family protein [Streptomyces erythrochromogenes]|uniref:TIGR04255 family protein n=1 Tax=Streptomyces erythrochromogenes TaxID=285574 RepID=UPI003692FD79
MELSWKLGAWMLLLPDPPRYAMGRAPLAQVIIQVSFPVLARLQTLDGIAPLQDALFDLFPYMNRNRVQQVSMLVGPTGPAASDSNEIWINEFTNDDGWTLTVTESSASLSVGGSDYPGLQDIEDMFEQVCTALTEAMNVRRCDRIGTRYMNVVRTDRLGWSTWFKPQIIGFADPELTPPEHLVATITETRLRRPPTGNFAWALDKPVEGITRYGVVPAGSVIAGVPPRPLDAPSLVLDIDMFIAAPQKFGPKALAEQFRELHTEIEKIFFWAVTDAGKEEFEVTVRGEEGSE